MKKSPNWSYVYLLFYALLFYVKCCNLETTNCSDTLLALCNIFHLEDNNITVQLLFFLGMPPHVVTKILMIKYLLVQQICKKDSVVRNSLNEITLNNIFFYLKFDVNIFGFDKRWNILMHWELKYPVSSLLTLLMSLDSKEISIEVEKFESFCLKISWRKYIRKGIVIKCKMQRCVWISRRWIIFSPVFSQNIACFMAPQKNGSEYFSHNF